MKTKAYFYSQRNHPLPRTAIEVKIFYQALYSGRTTLVHKFDEMSNLCTDRISGGAKQKRVFLLKNS